MNLKPQPADHTRKIFQKQKDGEIFYKISTGRNAMPAFQHTISENELWCVVNFVRTLAEKSLPVSVPQKTVKQKKTVTESVKDTLSAHPTKIHSTINETSTISNDSIPQINIPSPNDSVSVLKNKNPDSTVLVYTEKLSYESGSVKEAEDTTSSEQIVVLNIVPLNQNQNTKNERRKFLLSGSAHTNLIVDGNKFKSAGFEFGFLPVLLWKPSKRLFFESHLHISIGSGSPRANTSSTGGGGMGLRHSGMTAAEPTTATSAPVGSSIMIAYANMAYFLNPYMTLTSGMFLSPFGIYAERLHPEWINKLPDAPIGMGHTDQMVPETELGVQFRGGLPIRKFKINYSLYISNGPTHMRLRAYLTEKETDEIVKFLKSIN